MQPHFEYDVDSDFFSTEQICSPLDCFIEFSEPRSLPVENITPTLLFEPNQNFNPTLLSNHQ